MFATALTSCVAPAARTTGGARVTAGRRPSHCAKGLKVMCQAAGQNDAICQSDQSSSRRGILKAAAASAALVISAPTAVVAAPACEDFTAGEGGLQFCDAVVGSGKEPAKGSLIRCHYTGRLASNGSVFDSSYNRGLPLSFKIGVREVIQGWDMGIAGAEGIPPMKEGGKRRLIIPAKLAYGERSVGGGLIPANSDLIFDVELLPPRKR